jgi:hypothetical protein
VNKIILTRRSQSDAEEEKAKKLNLNNSSTFPFVDISSKTIKGNLCVPSALSANSAVEIQFFRKSPD